MKKFIQCLKTCAGIPPQTGLFLVTGLCLCFLLFTNSSSKAADILFQHNFENLDNPPTDTQLSTPNIIHPDLTNIFFNSGLLYRTRTDAGQKALSITASGNSAIYYLEVQIPVCKKMTINSISFKGFASDNVTFSVTLNGNAYGGATTSAANAYTNVQLNKNTSLSGIRDRGNQAQIVITVNSTKSGTVSSIDDLTINGSMSDAVSTLETMAFPFKTYLLPERCPGPGSINYIADLKTPYKSITYSLDNGSSAAGVTVTSDGLVTFPNTFSGKTTISSTATGCANESLTKTSVVLTTASGPASLELDFQTEWLSERFPDNGALKNAKNPCFTAGFIHASGFDGTRVSANVRFEGGVRNFEISGHPSIGVEFTPGFDLYYRQSDFDNYHGTLSLPTGPSDVQGKENLRLMIRTVDPTNVNPIQKIKPTVTWNAAGQWWVVSYTFSSNGLAAPWPADRFKVFLSDAEVPFVKIASFSGTHNSEGDHLTWKTSQEVHVSRFEVENSEDTLQGFTHLANVSPGNNPSGGNYSYTHTPSAAFKQFYRLKTVYSDNTFLYSKIITVRSDIIYQHTFENLGSPPTEAQLANPDMIASVLTSSWTFNAGSLVRYEPVAGIRSTVLGLTSRNTLPVLILKLKVPNCKYLNIRGFSGIIGGNGYGDMRISINGSAGFTFKQSNNWAPILVESNSSGRAGEITIEISQPGGNDGIYIDDFTIYGTITDNLVDLRTIGLPSAIQRCQQGENLNYRAARYGEYKSIQYSLDDLSVAAGNHIDINTGLLTLAPTFSGETTVSASAVNCINVPVSASTKIVTTVGGLPLADMDFTVKLLGIYNEQNCPRCGYMDNGCFKAGSIMGVAYNDATIKVKLLFVDNVRRYKITGGYYSDDSDQTRLTLFFSQSDFDNYKGKLKLPKNPTDEQGKKNFRLLMTTSYNAVKLTADLTWDELDRKWIVTYLFSDSSGDGPRFGLGEKTFSLSEADDAMPVKLESISATPTPEGNRITWKTTEEINFSHFEIESSVDPRQGFKYLATVSSAKQLSGSNYHYTDVPSSALQQYYRLKMVDFDGSFEYSKIVTATGGELNENQLLVYPNPIEDYIFLQSPDALKSVILIDQKGNEVFGTSLIEGEKFLKIPLPKLNAGAYYLKVNAGKDNQQVRKVLLK